MSNRDETRFPLVGVLSIGDFDNLKLKLQNVCVQSPERSKSTFLPNKALQSKTISETNSKSLKDAYK